MFIKLRGQLIPVDSIEKVDLYQLEDFRIHVHLKTVPGSEVVEGIEAINLVMRLCPSALEGRRLRWLRHAWAIHNLVGHPLMQLLSFFGQHKLAMKVHEATVPQPVGPK